jgi:glycosyltransferase involved in cell wall biosynthesis
VILAVGRLSREKAHRDLLHAAALLRERYPALPFRVVVAGDGPERSALQKARNRLGLGAEVIFAGHQENIGPYYGMARVLALPSHTEGSPNVVLESMASGLPVAATAVGGVPEIVQDGVTGLLVAPGDPAAMADAIARLVREPELAGRLASAARTRVVEEYSREAYRRSLVGFYVDVLGAYAGTLDYKSGGLCASA